MDRAVLSAVIGRSVGPRDLLAATIDGYRCVYAQGVTYPVLIPKQGSLVSGCLFRTKAANEVARLDRFEGSNYRRVTHPVLREQGKKTIQANVYLPVDHVSYGDEDWIFDDWIRRHRRQYLWRVSRWMQPG